MSVNIYLGRWLLISAAMFLISGMVYALGSGAASPNRSGRSRPLARTRSSRHRSLAWRIGRGSSSRVPRWRSLWVAAALVVGLITNGI